VLASLGVLLAVRLGWPHEFGLGVHRPTRRIYIHTKHVVQEALVCSTRTRLIAHVGANEDEKAIERLIPTERSRGHRSEGQIHPPGAPRIGKLTAKQPSVLLPTTGGGGDWD
jgi:hypothetical protein